MKVHIVEGCIVCDMCESLCEEVFEVLEDTSVVRNGMGDPVPSELEDSVREAAEACPVEVIKVEV